MFSISSRKHRENKKGNSLVYIDYQNVNDLEILPALVLWKAHRSLVWHSWFTAALSILCWNTPESSGLLLNTIIVNCFVSFSTALKTQTSYPPTISTTTRPPRRCNISSSKIPLTGLLSVSLHSQIGCYKLSLLLLSIILFPAIIVSSSS